MAKGDPNYVFISSGCTATSANTTHLFFGNYTGLSDLNQDEALHIQVVAASGQGLRVGDSTISNNKGLAISPALSIVDLPPMRAATASQLRLARDGSSGDASAIWAVWARRP
jgi:hypothetical protein